MKILSQNEFTSPYAESILRFADHRIDNLKYTPYGFYGSFCYTFGTLVADDALETFLENTPKFTEEIKDCLDKFRDNDWGEVSDKIESYNIDAKHLRDAAEGMIALYKTSQGYLRVDTFWIEKQKGQKEKCLFTLLTFDKEKDKIYKQTDTANFNLNDIHKSTVKAFYRNTIKTNNIPEKKRDR